MRWLIVEDALRDRKGHWFEYVRAFRNCLLQLGDSVTVLASKEAEAFIQTELQAKPVLPASIWHRMSDGTSTVKRYWRIPLHAFATWRSVRAALKADDEYDMIFVPTVSVHHLLGWARLIKGPLQNSRARILLYFLSTPIRLGVDGIPAWNKSPTSRLMAKLFSSLRSEVDRGKVVIAVETMALQKALSQLAGVQVRYLPQPVELLVENPATPQSELLLACYGAARHEKGSDLLQSAIAYYLQARPQTRSRFAIQWIEDFYDENGKMVAKSPILSKDGRVEFITRYFRNGEYAQRLSNTSILLLPYRLSSYRLRGSRVLIEAMVNGIPVVATRGTTLAEQAEQFGAAVLCENENVDNLVAAIEIAERDYETLAVKARERRAAARAHFSVRQFRDALLSG
jgi:glycosyltransferase involved in cell wall biosynthesis